MDKLSIYELLSFLVPGFIAAKIIEYYLNLYHVALPFPMEGKLDENLLFIVISLILGLSIHVLVFKLINFSSLKWLKNWIYKPELEYVKNSKGTELPMIMNAVNEHYVNDKQHIDIKTEIDLNEGKKLDYFPWIFDFAYYYLEVNDKITQAKNFQSFYFMFRNLFIISIIHFVFLIILMLSAKIGNDISGILSPNTYYMILFLLFITWLIVIIAGWLRGKMIDRVLWSYYVDRRIKEIDNKKK